MRLALLSAIAMVAAGCATPADHEGHDAVLDTGDIPPASEMPLRFDVAEPLEIHCHPHPWMRQNVTLTGEPPTEVHVDILDGSEENEFRFEPSELRIGRGSTVTYHNHGNFTHTATQRTEASLSHA